MDTLLASQSPYRRAQLERFGLKFRTLKPTVDEEMLKDSGPAEPEALALFLAQRKAASLVTTNPEALIIGGDQLVDLDGERLDKPGDRARAVEQLRRLRGRAHRLVTALALYQGTHAWSEAIVTTIHMRDVDDETLVAYVDLDQPFDCAGSYKIERAGLSLIERVDGPDPSAIEGLPLVSLVRGFKHLKINLSRQWRLPR